ncbi:MAG: arginine N-succinyltransferase [Opitutaceae bacterium]
MLVLRPIRENDLPGLVALARATGGGLTTLPPDETFLAERIDESLRAFRPRVRKPCGEYYLFVLEDTAAGEIVGTSGLASRVGGFEPFYSYEIHTERYAHRPLRIEKEIATLHLKESHRGPSEACSLFLRADRRRDGNGRLLSLARFLFIAAFRRRFTETIIAELRGYIDQTGRSPFWEAVGRPFFEFDFYRADVLSGLGEKEFIADLMPDHPIYVPLLPSEVQAVIGRVHHDTEPALALLRAECFSATNEIDIFDAGPLVRAEVAALRTIRQAQTAPVREIVEASGDDARTHLLCNGALDFRACVGAIAPRADGVALTQPLAAALQLRVGDALTFSPLK